MQQLMYPPKPATAPAEEKYSDNETSLRAFFASVYFLYFAFPLWYNCLSDLKNAKEVML